MSKYRACKDGSKSVRTAFSMGSLQKDFFTAYKEAYKENIEILKDSKKIIEQKIRKKQSA